VARLSRLIGAASGRVNKLADWPYNTTRWQRIRKRQLAREPICRACKADGYIVQADQVDHIIPIANNGPVWSPANLQSLCALHPSMKTNYDMQGKDWDRYSVRGCNPDGSKRDPNHPWHREFPSRCVCQAPPAFKD
jgi:5-methylcytosine-specific restriction enzyme A